MEPDSSVSSCGSRTLVFSGCTTLATESAQRHSGDRRAHIVSVCLVLPTSMTSQNQSHGPPTDRHLSSSWKVWGQPFSTVVGSRDVSHPRQTRELKTPFLCDAVGWDTRVRSYLSFGLDIVRNEILSASIVGGAPR